MYYGDRIKFVEGKPVPRIGRYGLMICGWCGSRVERQYADADAPWLCDDCGISRRVHHARYGSPNETPLAALSRRQGRMSYLELLYAVSRLLPEPEAAQMEVIA